MKRTHLATLLMAAAVAAAGATGCGDSGNDCGPGTTAVDGECVADVSCGPGTTAMGGECVADVDCGAGTTEVNGECLPDGSVICEQGTVFDTASGTCVLDPSACAAGTVLVGDECVTEDATLPDLADHTEGAEPNGPGDANLAGQFAAPAIGSNVTFYGCVDPVEDPVGGDFDTWVVTTTGPAVLDVTIDGIGGLVAGFAMVDGTNNPILDNWQRLGLNLTGDTASRQVYVPTAGAWALFVTDGRTLFFGEPAGSDTSCYFGTVSAVALPAPVTLTVPQTAATDNGDVKIYRHTAAAVAEILDVTVNSGGGALAPAALITRGGTLISSLADDGSGNPLFATLGGLNTTGDDVQIIWDAEYNYALAAQPFTLDSFAIGAQALPTAGEDLVVTKRNGATAGAGYVDLNYLYFDVAAPSLLHWNLTSTVPVDMVLLRRDIFTPAGAFDTFASINAFGSTGVATFQGQFTRFLTPGRYYFVTQDPAGTAGDTFTITNTLTPMTTTPVVYGTPLTGNALPTQSSGFHTLDLTTPTWVQFGGTGTDWGAGTVRIDAYDLAGEGWLAAGNYAPVFGAFQPSTGATPFGRIMLGDTRDYLIRVSASAAVGTTPMYDLAIGDRAHVDLGTLAAGTPITRSNMDALPATTGVTRYLVRGAGGNEYAVVADPADALPGGDVRIRRLGADEAVAQTVNTGGVNATETLGGAFAAAPGNWLAFTVENFGAAATDLDPLSLTASAPVPFTITSGTLPYVDACSATGGVTVGTNGDDDVFAGQTLPFAFSLYGSAVTTFTLTANGVLSFAYGAPSSTGAWNNTGIPSTAAPNALLVSFWDDLEHVTLCRVDTADTVTLQWNGDPWDSGGSTVNPVQTQIVLHSSGVVDFIWGPGHVNTGSGATVGAENLSGLFGQQISFNATGTTVAGTSRTLTP